MKAKILTKILLKGQDPVKRSDIAKKMQLSESSIRNLVKEINQDSLKNGFQIELVKGRGYVIDILDEAAFQAYKDKEQRLPDLDLYNAGQRLNAMLFYILQANGHFSVEQLMEKMPLSRSTLIKELERVDEELAKLDLDLERKKHYGIRVNGSEQNFRKAFYKYVLSSEFYLEPTREYKVFLESVNTAELKYMLSEALALYQFRISDVAFDNIIAHLKILIFRVSQGNFISIESFRKMEIGEIYYKVAEHISDWIKRKHNTALPDCEIQLLAAHISAKTMFDAVNIQEKNVLSNELREILSQLDKEFLTVTSHDEDLNGSLLLHMFPLLNRLYYNLQLENPIIEEIYTEYANVFVISYRFAELIEKKYGFSLSRDEIGYLAIHFAVHLERMENKSLEKIKRIVVICATGGGFAHMIRLKLENVFTNAIVLTISIRDIKELDDELPDVFLTTIPMEEEYAGVPVIHIKHFLDETEIARIKEIIVFQVSDRKASSPVLKLISLFNDKYFQRVCGGNYLEILKHMADKMIEEGAASEDFTDSVLEREGKFTTIYKNGVAGPHPMKLNAIVDTVGVVILEEPAEWQDKSVQLIFLINLKQEHLFLHKEISRLLLYLIDNAPMREKVIGCSTFKQFIAALDKII